jgi:hypothetical protein
MPFGDGCVTLSHDCTSHYVFHIPLVISRLAMGMVSLAQCLLRARVARYEAATLARTMHIATTMPYPFDTI